LVSNPLSDLPGYALRRASQAMTADLARRLETIELRITEASVLILINDRSDLTSSEIGKVLDIQRANMVPLLGRLAAAGLIAREPIDRKSQAVVLTTAGHDMLLKVREITAAFERDLLERIPAPHRAHFLPALKALIS
jgi:DNA-binding MarR family transcriptional regulator